MASILNGIFLRAKVLGLGRMLRPIDNKHGERHASAPQNRSNRRLLCTVTSTIRRIRRGRPAQKCLVSPLTIWKDPSVVGHGTIVVMDVKTFSVKRLSLLNYSGPFNTHGIDITTDPKDPAWIYVVAVSHLPNPAYYTSKDTNAPKARFRLEIFHHELHSQVAIHSLNEIYVTNDHYHLDGPLRMLEEVAYGSLGQSSNLVHLHITNPFLASQHANGKIDDTTGVTGTAANIIDMNNGLGHGRTPEEIMVVRATISQLLLTHVDKDIPPQLKIDEVIQLPSTLDNPSYFSDPFAQQTERDASGYVLAGLPRAVTFPLAGEKIPVMVWLVQPNRDGDLQSSDGKKGSDRWTVKLIFQDDGLLVRTASTAVLVAFDPSENGGRKQGNLFVTGPLSRGVVVSRIHL